MGEANARDEMILGMSGMLDWQKYYVFVILSNYSFVTAYQSSPMYRETPSTRQGREKLWYLQELEHDHAQEADERGAVLEATEV